MLLKRRVGILLVIFFVSCSTLRTPKDLYYAVAPLKKPEAPEYYLEDLYDGLFTGYENVKNEFATEFIDSMYVLVKEQYRKELLELGLPEDAYQRREVMKWALYFARHANVKINARLKRGAPYLPYIKRRLKEEGMPEAIAYLPIIESAFRHNALSRMRARGMWQFMRSTARKYGLRVDWWMDERLDPYKSTDAAIRYLKDLYSMFGSWDLALAAYNAGEGRILRALRRSGGDDFFDLKRYLRRETREYVPKFLALALVINNPEKFGTNIVMPENEEPVFDTVYIPRQVNISLLARWAGITEREFRRLNPSFIRWATPPYLKNFPVRIPKGRKKTFYALMKKTPRSKWYRALAHRVRRGESLWSIARKYGVSVYALKRANRIRRARYIRPGQVLVIPVGAGSRMRYTKRNSRIKVTRKGYHRVKEGETLWSIARAYGVSVSAIKRANRLKTSRIKPGDLLKIPKSKGSIMARKGKSRNTPDISTKGYHRVRKGETIWSIARKYGVTVSQIKALNHLRSTRIKPGDMLRIPSNRAYVKVKSKSRSRRHGYYTVKKGDTLWKIARKSGVSVKKIKEINGLATSRIKPGQVLKIPTEG